MSKTPRAERAKKLRAGEKIIGAAHTSSAAPVPEARLTPGMYYTVNIAKTKASMRQEAANEHERVRATERADTKQKINAALDKAGYASIEQMGLIAERGDSGSRYSIRLGDDGAVMVAVSLEYRAQFNGDYTKARKLDARAEALRSGISAAANFSSFCKMQVGGKSGDPLPESQLNVLWERWIEFTCGSRP